MTGGVETGAAGGVCDEVVVPGGNSGAGVEIGAIGLVIGRFGCVPAGTKMRTTVLPEPTPEVIPPAAPAGIITPWLPPPAQPTATIATQNAEPARSVARFKRIALVEHTLYVGAYVGR